MAAGVVTKKFGVLATDSAAYDTEQGKTQFESGKLFIGAKTGYVLTFIGTALYFSDSKPELFSLPFDKLCGELSSYLLEKRTHVAQKMKDAILDEDENKPHLCVLLMGMHLGYPTLAQFNSFLDFKPKYLYSDGGAKFSTIFYGDDSKPEKAALFKEATEYMEAKAAQLGGELTPGLCGEVLARGIYRKADEEKKRFGKKYAGGMVNAACVTPAGTRALTGFNII